jgi:hypothetical protein
VQTYSADEYWAPHCDNDSSDKSWGPSHAREHSGEPLAATRNGNRFEVAWRNASGEPYVTYCQSILEVRVFLSLSCADSETRDKLEEDWQNFMERHKQDTEQKYSATVDIPTTIGPVSEFDGRRAFAVNGVPKWLSPDCYGCFRCCLLGWLYRLCYTTQNGVVEMHLHRSLKIGRFDDDENRRR